MSGGKKIRFVLYNLLMVGLFPIVFITFSVLMDTTDNDFTATPLTIAIGWILLVLYLSGLFFINYKGLKTYELVGRMISAIVLCVMNIITSFVVLYVIMDQLA